MKFNLIININLAVSFLFFSLGCDSQSKEIDSVDLVGVHQETGIGLNEYESKSTESDSALAVRKFLGISSYRLNEIGHSLDRINSELNAEKENMSLVVGGGLFQLNKKHLELKSKLRESVNYTGSTWLEFEEGLTSEIDLLDSAILNFNKNIKPN